MTTPDNSADNEAFNALVDSVMAESEFEKTTRNLSSMVEGVLTQDLLPDQIERTIEREMLFALPARHTAPTMGDGTTLEWLINAHQYHADETDLQDPKRKYVRLKEELTTTVLEIYSPSETQISDEPIAEIQIAYGQPPNIVCKDPGTLKTMIGKDLDDVLDREDFVDVGFNGGYIVASHIVGILENGSDSGSAMDILSTLHGLAGELNVPTTEKLESIELRHGETDVELTFNRLYGPYGDRIDLDMGVRYDPSYLDQPLGPDPGEIGAYDLCSIGLDPRPIGELLGVPFSGLEDVQFTLHFDGTAELYLVDIEGAPLGPQSHPMTEQFCDVLSSFIHDLRSRLLLDRSRNLPQ